MALLGEVRIARGDLVFKELKGLSEEKINELKGMGLPEPPQPTERRGARGKPATADEVATAEAEAAA